MRFNLIDRITSLEPGRRIASVKTVSLAEEYLADHFPRFPVMPGVLMLEALVQASAWLVRASESFAHSLLLMSEAKNVTYKSFVTPGQVLEIEVEAKRIETETSAFSGVGRSGGRETVKARWALRHVQLSSEDPGFAELDKRLVKQARRQFELLTAGLPGEDGHGR